MTAHLKRSSRMNAQRLRQARKNLKSAMLHFKALVTISGHLSDKIFIASHLMKNLKTYPCNMAYMLYFQKMVGLTSLGRLEMGL